ncbi:hypothetical protein ACFO8N_09835 [Sneathiella chungangensis]|nr:hypothetical protein [Sneathiella chungangensis]
MMSEEAADALVIGVIRMGLIVPDSFVKYHKETGPTALIGLSLP